MTLDRPSAKGAHAAGSKAPRHGWRGDGTFERPPGAIGRRKLRGGVGVTVSRRVARGLAAAFV